MRVVSLKQSSPERVTVCLDDGTEIASTLAAVTELRLYNGRELDDAALDGLRRESARSLGREKALELLSRRQMSRKELLQKLKDKGFDEETAGYCADWVLERGLIDEERYAAAVVRHYAAKGCGAGRIRRELMQRGIPRELWDEALETMPEGNDRLDRLIAAKLKDPDDREAVRRLSASLYRRGFSSEEIRAALDRSRAAYEYEE